jgi:hypothetical protein
MAGEVRSSTPQEIDAPGDQSRRGHGITTLHFYRYEDGVQTAVWDAIKAL